MKLKTRYTDQEIETLKVFFKDNDALLMVIRKFFLDGHLNDDEKKIFSMFKENSRLVSLVKKELLPEIDSNAPFFQLIDLFYTIDVKNLVVEGAYYQMQMTEMLCDYLRQRFAEITDGAPPTLSLASLVYEKNKGSIQAYIDLGARNLILTYIDKHLFQLGELAKTEWEETEAEKKARKERENKDSME